MAGAAVVAAASFETRFGFLRKPPVESSGFIGEVEVVRDRGPKASV